MIWFVIGFISGMVSLCGLYLLVLMAGFNERKNNGGPRRDWEKLDQSLPPMKDTDFI
jgi:hypothetical protein